MYHNFPALPLVTKAVEIDMEREMSHPEGCALLTVLPPVEVVQISYPAICHLLHSCGAEARRTPVFGRLFGLQLKDTVMVTDMHSNPATEPPAEYETREETERRRADEREKTTERFDELARMYYEEEFDTYQVGQFVVCSVTNNVLFTTRTLQHLMELYDRSQPAVVLHYDQVRTGLLGKPYIRAFVPTNEYIRYHELQKVKVRTTKDNRLVRESKVSSTGVLREVRVELDVDAYHTLGLSKVSVSRTDDTFNILQSEAVSSYVLALVNAIRTNTDDLTSSLEYEAKVNQRETNGTMPLAQRVDTLLKLQHLRELTQHLEALCDGVLLSSSILRDL